MRTHPIPADRADGLPGDPDALARTAAGLVPPCDAWSVRHVSTVGERLSVRRDVVEPPAFWDDAGAMVTVNIGAGSGHAAVARPDEAGLRAAFERAALAARATAAAALVDAREFPPARTHARYRSPCVRPWEPGPAQRLELTRAACASMAAGDRIVDRTAALMHERVRQLLVSSAGARIEQHFAFTIPDLRVTARAHGRVQTRSLAGPGNGIGRQGGAEVLDEIGFTTRGVALAEEALLLTAAPNCPDATLDLLLMPDQMMLQIHESIGHPLELDRILGDERNFAGGSFVTLDMLGHYQYGSEHLNVSFDPGVAGELACYGCDDDGTPARRETLIREGRLLRPLGGELSSLRARGAGHDVAAVACSRASGWNRAPIDRMANLNIEPGEWSLDRMIASVERGILMRTNTSWSIDDRRDKFQFGCEFGRLIVDGELREVVRNPNYRGRSATFWRSLRAVGDDASAACHGTPFCGKGEPMQIARVGHASPPCLFTGVAVFGAET